MRIISPVTVELTDAELVTIQRALERWPGMDDKLAQRRQQVQPRIKPTTEDA